MTTDAPSKLPGNKVPLSILLPTYLTDVDLSHAAHVLGALQSANRQAQATGSPNVSLGTYCGLPCGMELTASINTADALTEALQSGSMPDVRNVLENTQLEVGIKIPIA